MRDSTGPIYVCDRRSLGVQILTAAGVKVAKNGIFDRGWVALGGSLTFCAVGICTLFEGFVSGDISQHRAYICETYWGPIKNWENFKKCQKGHIRMATFRAGGGSGNFLFGGNITH